MGFFASTPKSANLGFQPHSVALNFVQNVVCLLDKFSSW